MWLDGSCIASFNIACEDEKSGNLADAQASYRTFISCANDKLSNGEVEDETKDAVEGLVMSAKNGIARCSAAVNGRADKVAKLKAAIAKIEDSLSRENDSLKSLASTNKAFLIYGEVTDIGDSGVTVFGHSMPLDSNFESVGTLVSTKGTMFIRKPSKIGGVLSMGAYVSMINRYESKASGTNMLGGPGTIWVFGPCSDVESMARLHKRIAERGDLLYRLNNDLYRATR